jgi:hypothetical protein
MPTALETESSAASSHTAAALPLARSSSIFHSDLAHIAARVFLYSILAVLFLRSFHITDPDIWWHLRTGEWILENRAIPDTDPFSLHGMGKPWVAYSWLFETALALFFRDFGLIAIVAYEVAVRVLLPLAMFHLVLGLLPRFWCAFALTAAGLFAISNIIGPRSGMLTILFLILELDILLCARRTGRRGILWLLPFLFLAWANWHIQFVYGLFLLGIFACEPLLNACMRYSPRHDSGLAPGTAWRAFLISSFATLINPQGANIYATVVELIGETAVYNHIVELMAMTFRQPQHFVAPLLVLGAGLAIGWRRDPRPLWLILLVVSSLLAFRSVKDVWFLAIVAICTIADGWQSERTSPKRAPFRSRLLVGLWVLAAVVASWRHYGVTRDALEIQMAGNFPEGATRFIEREKLSGPLFNDLSWGGFLIWRLPHLPVSMDGRTNVHGEQRIQHFSDVWRGKPGWESSTELEQANVVITPEDAAIASLLRFDSRFRVGYEDAQAVVFVRRDRNSGTP